MTRDQLIAKLADIEWEDFEVKEAKSDIPKNAWETAIPFLPSFSVRFALRKMQVPGSLR
jgi:hypothetical protein